MQKEKSRNALFDQVAAELGCSFDGELKIGGNYVSTIVHGDHIYITGQIPRVGDTVLVTGRVGEEVSLAQAQRGASICTMRALALLKQSLGDLDKVEKILRITVYVQSAPDFSQQSEVADGASQVLHTVFSSAGVHTRTSVGVFQLPKHAAVEIDMIAIAKTKSGTDNT